ncbi:hypothetical protein SAMN02745248_00318 [Hathewaya proteolytica DSM 3090]|uniref:Uncharacterized protein n=1 Tax=Hathewaya proteolytica DSM 3090 TaxID=1121331 RepID=A0A1M6K2U4_9CLOT|nr:hypothetical protein [Hathewaya proteolytica]SHJ53319.1 hypothetical protein SAMN02745248_00318 [Hathewaya proteolytica DSM 3090]
MNDKDIQSLLNKILENQSSMKSEMDFIKTEITSMKTEITSIKTDITSMKSEMASIKNNLERNTLMLEKVHTDVKTIAEVQGAFSEQMERAKTRDGKSLDERLDIIELAITNSHNLVKNISDKIDDLSQDVILVEAVSGKNMKDIAHLKLIK